MRKKLLILGLLPVLAYAASTYTTNYSLEKPADGDATSSWNEAFRDNMDTIDSQMSVNANAINNHINDTVDAHDASAISVDDSAFSVCTSDDNVQDQLQCLDSNINLLSGGGAVDLTSAQTISGLKTFSTTPKFSALGVGSLKITNVDGTISSALISNADIDASAAIDRSKLADGTADHVVINDGSGGFSSEAQLDISRGGTGQATAQDAFDALSPLTTEGDLLLHDGSNNSRLAIGSADTVLKSNGTTASWGKIADADIASGASIARWVKYTKTYTDFSAAATSNTVLLGAMSSKVVVEAVIVKHATAFSGGSISAYTVEVGSAADADEYAAPFSVFQAVSEGAHLVSQSFRMSLFGSAQNLNATARSVGANLNAATQGSVEIWVKTSLLP